ncbi:hypothetical protein PRIPAC_72781 [Pristionchus pacificus]|uniref:Uncharacterized protein n=1 Tax=Pristionchus pacificus TaxID=54126 RepID=A0A2A6C6D3_PRIPA|nr:hypothetical protein PRIPAC_72781 [Pristionchus pacificus]|eukprot:PDM73735.1 hypothetical protein PRIPAC_41091 [Pristionchus pacificus]
MGYSFFCLILVIGSAAAATVDDTASTMRYLVLCPILLIGTVLSVDIYPRANADSGMLPTNSGRPADFVSRTVYLLMNGQTVAEHMQPAATGRDGAK